MESKDEWKKIDIENRACYYFDDIITDRDMNFDNALLGKMCENLWKFIQSFNKCKAIAF